MAVDLDKVKAFVADERRRFKGGDLMRLGPGLDHIDALVAEVEALRQNLATVVKEADEEVERLEGLYRKEVLHNRD